MDAILARSAGSTMLLTSTKWSVLALTIGGGRMWCWHDTPDHFTAILDDATRQLLQQGFTKYSNYMPLIATRLPSNIAT